VGAAPLGQQPPAAPTTPAATGHGSSCPATAFTPASSWSASLVAWQPKLNRPGVIREADAHGPIPDLVRRCFAADAPGQLLIQTTLTIPLEGLPVPGCRHRQGHQGRHPPRHGRSLQEIASGVASTEAAARNVALQPEALCHCARGTNYTSARHAEVLCGLGVAVNRSGAPGPVSTTQCLSCSSPALQTE
jgi:hypothetical protein